jgi:tetratricopeptide (TPR) repeat protein
MKQAFSEHIRVTLILLIFSFLLLGMIIFYELPPNLFWKYPVAAQNYISGTLEQERLADFSPLYLYLHIIVHKYFNNPNAVILWFQIILTSVASCFLFNLLRKHCNLPIALLGALVFITNQSVIVYTSTFEPEPLMICFVLGYLVFAHQDRHLAAFTAGLFLSLSLLTRSNFFPLIFITPVAYWLREKNRKRCVRAVILFLTPITIAMSFLIVRNTMHTGAVTLFAMNPGHVFFEGNNPISTGESAIYPPLVYDSREDFPSGSDYRHELYRLFARRIAEKPVTVAESNQYWMNKAKNFIFDHPGHFFPLLLTKITFFFHDFKRHDIWYLYVKDRRVQEVLPSLPFALVTAMALVGLLLSVNAWKDKLLIYAVFFTQFGIMLLTYVSERQRVGIIAILIFFGAEVLQVIIQKKRYIIITVSVVILALILNMQNDLIRDDIHVHRGTRRCDEMIRQSADYRKKAHLPLAAQANALGFAAAPWRQENIRLSALQFKPKAFQEQALETALLLNDNSPPAHFDLAILYIANNRLDDAESILKNLMQQAYQFNRRYTQCSLPEYYLARIYEWRGNSTQAISHLKHALDKNPGDPWVLSLLAALANDKIYEDRMFRYFDDIDAAFFLGQAYLETGRNETAIKHFFYVVNRLPEYRKGLIYYSLALGAAGRYRQAAESYLTAINMRRDPIFRERDIINIFINWVRENPQDAGAKAHLGRVLEDFGHY